jgi:hypothetical protein
MICVRDDEWSKLYAVPVTLRQVQAAGIKLNSEFGIDDDEHQKLLDDTTILRAVFGVEMDQSYDITEVYAIETYCGRIGQDAGWENALQTYYSASDSRDRANAAINMGNVERFITQIIGYDKLRETLDQASKPFIDWANEVRANEVRNEEA